MGLLSSVIFYKLGKRSANRKIERQLKRDDIMKSDFFHFDLDPEGEEFAEEHMLMEEEQMEEDESAPPSGCFRL